MGGDQEEEEEIHQKVQIQEKWSSQTCCSSAFILYPLKNKNKMKSWEKNEKIRKRKRI
jgi:hypothetical protein